MLSHTYFMLISIFCHSTLLFSPQNLSVELMDKIYTLYKYMFCHCFSITVFNLSNW